MKMYDHPKDKAEKCSKCGRVLWRKWWDRHDGLGYFTGRYEDQKPVCWNGKLCNKRKAGAV